MLRSIIVLAAMGACALYLYGKQDSPEHSAPETRIARDTSGIKNLEGRLPKTFFEKEIAPLIRTNELKGLTSAQSGDLVEKLRSLGGTLGKEIDSGIEDALRRFSPELLKEKHGNNGASQKGNTSSSSGGRDWEPLLADAGHYTEMFVNGLITAFSRLLELAAELLRK